MTTLFLYGLGFCCVSIIALLILDAHLAKRRQREWAEDWKPAGSSSAGDAGLSGGVSWKRPKIFKPGFLIMMAVSILLVVTIKRHGTSPHQVSTAQTQDDDAGSMTADAGLSTDGTDEHPWSFTTALTPYHSTLFQDSTSGNASEWLDTFEWIMGSGPLPDAEADFNSSAALGHFNFSSDQNGSDATRLLSQANNEDYDLNSELSQTGWQIKSTARIVSCPP